MSFWGNAVLILALLVAIYSIASALLDSRKNRFGFPTNARYGVFAVAGLVTLAVGLLIVSFLTHNYSLQYVYNNSSNSTPFIYLVSALWRDNAGALLLWAWVIALGGFFLLRREQKVGKEQLPYALPIILFTEILFLILILIDTPFKALTPVPSDGFGLNPLLQNLGMVFHPPLLITGLALFVIPFAFAIAALITKKINGDWLVASRRWAIAAWLLLGLGNIIGAWWAYVELNWGGYWGWDPVENSGLMPWLLMTAFLHSVMIQKQRGLSRMWTTLLIIFGFVFTILETFITRTDLSSLHGFSQTGASTYILIIFLVCILTYSLGVVISHRRTLESEPGDNAVVSGDSSFFVTNLLFSILTVFVLFGTLYPFLTELFTGNRAEFAPASFDLTGLPLFLAILLLAGLCVNIGWGKPDLAKFRKTLLWPLGITVIALVALIIGGINRWNVLVALFMILFGLTATLVKWVQDVSHRNKTQGGGIFKAFSMLFMTNRRRYGAYIVHISLFVIALGILGSSAYVTKLQNITLNPGESVNSGDYTLLLKSMTPTNSGNNMIISADLVISHNGKVIAEVYPRDINYENYGWVVDTSIQSRIDKDIWVSMENIDPATNQMLDTPIFTVQISPLIVWIWIGGALLLIGGVVSFSAQPYRDALERNSTPARKKR